MLRGRGDATAGVRLRYNITRNEQASGKSPEALSYTQASSEPICSEVVAVQFASAAQPISIVSHYFTDLIDSFVMAEHVEMENQRAELERAYTSTVMEQQHEQDQLRSTIRELSTSAIDTASELLPR